LKIVAKGQKEDDFTDEATASKADQAAYGNEMSHMRDI